MSSTTTEDGVSASVQAVGNERVARVTADVISALHQALERYRVTEEEWLAALQFLTEVGRHDEFVLLSDVTRTSVLIDALSHGSGAPDTTASDVEGPMYRDDPPWREYPVKIYEEYEGMGDGDVLFVAGEVTSADGSPLSDAVVDVWQTGPSGGYDLWDPRQPAYNFRGRFGVDGSGRYEFQTMVPRPYTVPTDGPVGRYLEMVGQHPWRPAHIHFRVDAADHERLTTQVFFPGDPYLDNDTIGAVKPALVRPLVRHDDERELAQRGVERPFYTCEFDIRLSRASRD
jgi:protocatechuate 3,4-dioxygenase beta subunit